MQSIASLSALVGSVAATWLPGALIDGADRQSKTIELVFGVRHPEAGVAELEKELLARSTPSSPMYGQWMSNDAVHMLVAPEERHIMAVEEHLKSFGITDMKYSPNKDFITADVTIDMAETILGGRYAVWEHDGTGKQATRLHPDFPMSLPENVMEAINLVEPTGRLPPTHEWLETAREPTVTLGASTPKTLRGLYNVTDIGSAGLANTGHAVTAFLEQYFSKNDFSMFWNVYGGATGVSKPDVAINGDAVYGKGGVESMLDIEYINSLGANIKSAFWGYSGRAGDDKENEPFLKWLVDLSGTPDEVVPKVFSTSYGENEDSTTLEAANRMNTEFMKAGARGISLLYASGDQGLNCIAHKPKAQWPGSSPYVTAVGGTTLSSDGEHAVGLSSGGFSDRWEQPAWQVDAVQSYIQSGASLKTFPEEKYYNGKGRAYPDVAALATGYPVVAGGIVNPGVAGTSCATPAFSGVVALLVDKRIAAGKSSLGFLNPLLYDNEKGLAGVMNDITQGHSRGCMFFPRSLKSGWTALPGWDAATGLGTPNYGRMLDVVLALP